MTIRTSDAHRWWEKYAAAAALFREAIDRLCHTPYVAGARDANGDPLPDAGALRQALVNMYSRQQARDLRVFRDLLKKAGLWHVFRARRRRSRDATRMCGLARRYTLAHAKMATVA